MTELLTAIYNFLSSALGIPVYPENGVPPDAVLPYCTWDPVMTDWESSGFMPVRVWDRFTSYRRTAEFADKLRTSLGEETILNIPSGYIILFPGDPFIQTQPMQNSDIKIMYINVGITTMIS